MSDREVELNKRVAEFFEKASPTIKREGAKLRIWVMALMVFLLSSLLIILIYPRNGNVLSPKGKITSADIDNKTGRKVSISGFTRNLAPGRDHVWLMVDVKRLGLCWPKEPKIKPNTGFKTSINEDGPNLKFTVSLYALNKSHNEIVVAWFKKRRLGGLPMFPKQYRIDSITLKLNSNNS